MNRLRALRLFLKIVWREDGIGGRVSARTAWQAARIIWLIDWKKKTAGSEPAATKEEVQDEG